MAHYGSLIAVVLGGTLGLILANVPCIFFGKSLMKYIPSYFIKYIAAIICACFFWCDLLYSYHRWLALLKNYYSEANNLQCH